MPETDVNNPLLAALSSASQSLNQCVLSTPTGEARTSLSIANIFLQHARDLLAGRPTPVGLDDLAQQVATERYDAAMQRAKEHPEWGGCAVCAPPAAADQYGTPEHEQMLLAEERQAELWQAANYQEALSRIVGKSETAGLADDYEHGSPSSGEPCAALLQGPRGYATCDLTRGHDGPHHGTYA
jgi:hypothetical protein